MTNEQHEWYWRGYNDAKNNEKNTTTEDKYLYLNWQDGQNEWFITAAPFKCTKFKFKVETL